MADAGPFAIVSNRCPRCHEGRVYEGLLRVRVSCEKCGFVFEQEQGQYFGALVVSYALGAVIAFPIFFILLARKASPLVALGVPVLVLAVLSPFLVRFSRLTWMHVMYLLHGPKGPR